MLSRIEYDFLFRAVVRLIVEGHVGHHLGQSAIRLDAFGSATTVRDRALQHSQRTTVRGDGLPFSGHSVERDSVNDAISALRVSAVNSCRVGVFLADSGVR